MVTITIDLVSDPICSWCFIAHRTLLKAVQLYKKTVPNGSMDSFNLTYHPYYLLDPSKPSTNKQEFQDKIMSRQRQKLTYNRIKQIGRFHGINFNFFEGEIGGTRETHRLIHLAQSRKNLDIRNAVVEGIFKAYHENAMNVSDWEVLKGIAVQNGIGCEEVDEWGDRDTDLGGDELDREVERIRSSIFNDDLGIRVQRGVPVVIVQGKYRIDGAPDVSELLDIFWKIKDGGIVEGGETGFMCEIGSTQC
ncbi:DSBA-like thioredoxin domain protein [Talaromyces proteolyticus]|uniref:DSBA-like thioredoxin domain protein n=1 Tax=Talaromyces proteolyticus TaxID=1131652 RepID=A0AAD4L4C1_9EURO|nr:DSBA-like thioredoxin domain protein [Talaromyces proteolyticus]KAH8703978.1 DSBA-like thioredoxin domain protein [Talaromyces proteolyticus]